MLQLIIGDSTLRLNVQRISVGGTFQMGLPSCPITARITVTIPGGNPDYGIDAAKNSVYDVHGTVLVSSWYFLASGLDLGFRI